MKQYRSGMTENRFFSHWTLTDSSIALINCAASCLVSTLASASFSSSDGASTGGFFSLALEVPLAAGRDMVQGWKNRRRRKKGQRIRRLTNDRVLCCAVRWVGVVERVCLRKRSDRLLAHPRTHTHTHTPITHSQRCRPRKQQQQLPMCMKSSVSCFLPLSLALPRRRRCPLYLLFLFRFHTCLSMSRSHRRRH